VKPRFSPKPPVIAASALVYFVAGKLGLMLALVNPSATAVWPPTGIALAAFLVLGYRVWPAILLGAFFVNVTTAGSIATSIGIAVGNTLEGFVGAYLVNRFANGRRAFDRPADIFKFALLAALVSTTVSPTIGITSLALGGFADWADFKSIWITWWLGDAVGDLVVAPVFLLWSLKPRQTRTWNRGKLLEASLLVLCLLLVGTAVFAVPLPFASKNYPLEFVCIPILLWAAFRFRPREAATAIVLLSAIAIWGTLRGYGPFRRETDNESLVLLQVFMGVVAVMTVALAAVVAERKRVEQSLSLLESAVHNADEGVAILAAESGGSGPGMIFVNEGFRRLTGLSSADVLGETLDVLGVSQVDHEAVEAMRIALAAGERFHGEVHARRRDGLAYALELTLTPVPPGEKPPTHWVAILRDVSERMAHLETLERQALYDFLTGLPNRILLHDRLDQAVLATEREGIPLALCLMDLDRFKEINDTWGHQVGDVVLKQLAPRLRAALRTVDTVARLGGDEFAILLPKVGDTHGATRLAEKILKALEEPFVIERHELAISASIGIALCPQHGKDWATLMRRADTAMYAAKKSSRRYALHSSEDLSSSEGPANAPRVGGAKRG
jgi:diguanylate cyclase (GGDEF)-like protein/PAS domain S-box-containing protein